MHPLLWHLLVACSDRPDPPASETGGAASGGPVAASLAVRAGGLLVLGDPAPGEPDRQNSLSVSGATPDGVVYLLQGLMAGSDASGPCPTGLAEPVVLASATADASGGATLLVDVPAEDANLTRLLQVVDAKCRSSDVRPVEWRVREWIGAWGPEVAEIKVRGSESFGVLGSRVSIQGDADGDGRLDLLIAAPRESEFGLSKSGSVYIFSAPTEGYYFTDVDEQGELVGAAPDDWAGFGLSWAGDLDQDGDDDLWVGSRFHDASRGVVYRVLSPVVDPDGVLVDAFPALVGEEEADQFGLDVARAADADGDGRPDLWAAAPMRADLAGTVYLVPGTYAAGAVVGDVALAEIVGAAPGDQLGLNVEPVGDVDGDGVDDIGLGSANSDANGEDAGTAYLVYQPHLGTSSANDVDVVLWGDSPGDAFGGRIAGLGDLDEDGSMDLGINAAGDASAGDGFGALLIIDGPLPTEVPVGDLLPTRLTGVEAEGQSAAHFVSCDVDGDGRLDLLVSSFETGPPGPQSGRVYLFYGPTPTGDRSLDEADAILEGDEATQNLGQSLSCADLDEDGFDDFAVGAEGDDNPWGGEYSGSVYVYMGRPRFGVDPPTTGPTDTDTETTPDPDPCCDEEERGTCGCAASPAGGPVVAGWLVALIATRGIRDRRRR